MTRGMSVTKRFYFGLLRSSINFLNKFSSWDFVNFSISFFKIWCIIMLSVVANVDDIVFDVEAALSQQLGTQPLPFPGMDSK